MEEYNKHRNIFIDFVFIGTERRTRFEDGSSLFRLIQESVQNALNIANPTEIQVKLEINETKVLAVIKDDGAGFDPTIKKEGSFGIRGMKTSRTFGGKT